MEEYILVASPFRGASVRHRRTGSKSGSKDPCYQFLETYLSLKRRGP